MIVKNSFFQRNTSQHVQFSSRRIALYINQNTKRWMYSRSEKANFPTPLFFGTLFLLLIHLIIVIIVETTKYANLHECVCTQPRSAECGNCWKWRTRICYLHFIMLCCFSYVWPPSTQTVGLLWNPDTAESHSLWAQVCWLLFIEPYLTSE